MRRSRFSAAQWGRSCSATSPMLTNLRISEKQCGCTYLLDDMVRMEWAVHTMLRSRKVEFCVFFPFKRAPGHRIVFNLALGSCSIPQSFHVILFPLTSHQKSRPLPPTSMRPAWARGLPGPRSRCAGAPPWVEDCRCWRRWHLQRWNRSLEDWQKWNEATMTLEKHQWRQIWKEIFLKRGAWISWISVVKSSCEDSKNWIDSWRLYLVPTGGGTQACSEATKKQWQ